MKKLLRVIGMAVVGMVFLLAEMPFAQEKVPEIKVPKPKKKYTVGIAVQSSFIPMHLRIGKAAELEGKKYGIESVILYGGGYGDVAKQVSQMEDLVQRKVNGIVLGPVSFEGLAPVVDEAVKKGIKVVEFITLSKSEKKMSAVTNDDEKIGRIMAEGHAQQLGGKGKVVMISGAAGAFWSKARSDGYRKLMKEKYQGIQILDEKWMAPIETGATMKVAEDLLLAHPDINGIYTTITAMARGAARAVEAAGKKGKIKLVAAALEGTEDIAPLFDGTLAAIVSEPGVLYGKWAMDYLIKALEGEKVPKMVYVPNPIYTRANICKVDLSIDFLPDEMAKIKDYLAKNCK